MAKTVGTFFLCLLTMTLVACGSADQNPVQENTAGNKAFFTPGTDVAVYSITHPDITDAIIDAHNRGANIRIVTDRMMAKNKGSLVGKIRNAGIPVLTNKKHKIEHNKFAVFDDVHVVSGSYNWTTNASKYNSENCVFFDQQNKEYSHRFEYLWDLYNAK